MAFLKKAANKAVHTVTGSSSSKDSVSLEISCPKSAEHVGHLSIGNQGAFNARNLPPELQQVLQDLDAGLKSMGMKGLTKDEMAFLLNEAAEQLQLANQASSPRSLSSSQSSLSASRKVLADGKDKPSEERKKLTSSGVDKPVRRQSISSETKDKIEKEHKSSKKHTLLIDKLESQRAALAEKLESNIVYHAQKEKELNEESLGLKNELENLKLQYEAAKNEWQGKETLLKSELNEIQDRLKEKEKELKEESESLAAVQIELGDQKQTNAQLNTNLIDAQNLINSKENDLKELRFKLDVGMSKSADTIKKAEEQLKQMSDNFQNQIKDLQEKLKKSQQEKAEVEQQCTKLRGDIGNKDAARRMYEEEFNAAKRESRAAKLEAEQSKEAQKALEQRMKQLQLDKEKAELEAKNARAMADLKETQMDRLRTELEGANIKLQSGSKPKESEVKKDVEVKEEVHHKKKEEAPAKAPPPPLAPPAPAAPTAQPPAPILRGKTVNDLLASIRKGKELKKVDGSEEAASKKSGVESNNNMVEALATALFARRANFGEPKEEDEDLWD